ncbi:unnamed protein product [Blepharisma stoltei]|uniref:START domain-containing protein n=1 Tax=Blepharisma stoltei TaxID=1481888 RepID=A0AAU9JCX8_9CILI|nr:unnamed protein product [Blepharisma stoltei]
MEKEFLTLTSVACHACVEAIDLIDDPSAWDGVHNSGRCVAYNKKVHPIDAYKVEGFIEKSPKQVIDYIYENWSELHCDMGSLILSSNTVRTYNSNARLISEITNFYPAEQPREILNFITRFELTDGAWAMGITNAEDYAHIPQSRYQRGNLKQGIHLARPIFNNKSMTHFIGMQFFDPKVDIPQDVSNEINNIRYLFYQRLISRIQTHIE